MSGPVHCVIHLCWMSAAVLLHGFGAFAFNISSQNQLWESPFLQLRASLPSVSQPIRPYTLLANSEDYHNMPQPRHHRPSRLLRLLGSSFDPFWMSIERPAEASGGHDDVRPLSPVKLPNHSIIKKKSDLRSPPELREAEVIQHQKLETELEGLDFGALPSDAARSLRSWLVDSASCKLYYQWKDLGQVFWPRWLRQTDCDGSDRGQSCSFPSGMECVRAQTAHVKILAWHCLKVRDVGDGSGKMESGRYNSSMDKGTSEEMKSCLWRQVPYPVVTACTCSCTSTFV